jgi:iron complex outermembrane receptor protein
MSPISRTLLFALLMAPAAMQAQAGRVTGVVSDSARIPLASAQVTIAGTRQGTLTDAEGRYTIANVAPGTYELRVQRIGERVKLVPNVAVRAGEETRADVTLDRAPLQLTSVVVSASRRPETVTDAPATIPRIEA